jgi:peptidoglycan/xylan/chitin deacetylase (PgdA/CDA1 family)
MIQDGPIKLRHLRSLGIRLGASTLYHTGALSLFGKLARWKREDLRNLQDDTRPFMILLYHRVNADGDPLFPAVPIKAFEAQMRYLARNFRVLSLADIVSGIQQGKAMEPLTIAITFDDGYQDNYTFAHPILRKYRLPASLFVATSFIGTNLLMWNDRLAWAVKNTEQKKVICQIGCREISLSLETQQDKLISLNVIIEELKACSEDEKKETLRNVVAALRNKTPEPSHLMLNWSELRAMNKEGWDIGSHTVNHPILTKVELPRVAEELITSKEVIERKLQHPVSLCAYPNGKGSDFNQDIKTIAKKSGYKGAATTLRGVNRSGLDLFELRRWSVWENHLPTLACKLGYLYRREMTYEDNS